MNKEKFHIEYVFDKVSRRSLWNHLSTPPGLSAWFADSIVMSESAATFTWGKEAQEAEVVTIRPEISIRYRWIDDEEPNTYFEFIIHTIELTGSTSLEITDFALPSEKADAIGLWDTQVDELKRSLGI